MGPVADDDLWAAASASDIGIRVRVIVANLVGAALVAIEAILLGVPEAGDAQRAQHDGMLSGLAGLAYIALVIPVELRLSTRRAARTFGWVEERRRPTDEEIADTIDFPWWQSRRVFLYWLGAAGLFVVLNLSLGNNVGYCLRTGMHIVLGGLTASALSFLLLERFNRPAFTLALAGEPPGNARFGLRWRLLLTWALGAAIPVAIIVTAPIGLTAERRAALTIPLLVVGALALAAGLVLTDFAARSITEPVDALRDAQARVGDGALEVEVAVHDAGEVGLLQAGFNRMVAGLRERHRIRELFGRHVGDEVARRALSQNPELGGEVKDASMLFVDLTGSTSLAQRLPAQQVVALLNELFSAVVRATSAEGGWVNKFQGDAALCVFGPPGDEPDHAARALRAARRLQQELLGISSDHGGLDAGIGVSTGTVVAGNVGAEDRYEYTVIGDPVNEAARLTDEAKRVAGRVLASGSTIAAAREEADRWERCGSQLLRGREQPTELFTPRSIHQAAGRSDRAVPEG